MKHYRIQIAIVLAIILVLTAAAVVSAHGNKNPGILPPNSKVQGLTYGEWSARWWQYILSIPTPENPLEGGAGNGCVIQRNGNVGLVGVDPVLGEPIYCEVPSGMILYFDIISVECSTIEEAPFYGGNEEELRTCALGFTISDLQASIDGVEVENMDQYVHTSPLYDFTLPEDNILFTNVLAGESISNGAQLMLTPLRPGEHTIDLHGSIPDLEWTVDMQIELTVVR